MNLPKLENCTIGIIGLGYVGLPLCVEFSEVKKCIKTNNQLNRKVIGFDVNLLRLKELKECVDRTNEVDEDKLKRNININYVSDEETLQDADVFIVTVPTPIDKSKRPDLSFLIKATETVSRAISLYKKKYFNKNPIVIYESTVYPGVTDEICIPLIESNTGFKINIDFGCGYSPERINPGDKVRKLKDIVKVTSGSSEEVALWIDNLYSSIIKAGTYSASSIKVAEASKVIENAQRDINIAFVNELSMVFNRMNIDTLDVLDAASTKWNFMKFKPGIVGGHCIGVDPYYLSFKSEELDYHPQVLTAGRRINDLWGNWAAEQLVLHMARVGKIVKDSEILILGFTFKENCPDIRNSRVEDIIKTLRSFGVKVEVIDPLANLNEVFDNYQLKISNQFSQSKKFDAIICAVAHNQFKNMSPKNWNSLIKKDGIFYDLKGIIPRELNPIRI